jgi:gluconolactonase
MRLYTLIALFIFSLGACDEKTPFPSHSIFLPGAKVQKVAGGFKFTEGPAVDLEGNIFFADLGNNKIYKWSVFDNKISIVLENSYGISGLSFDSEGILYACQRDKGQIISIAPNGIQVVLAQEYQGKPFFKANDVWVDPKGGVYFTHRDDKPLLNEKYGGHIFYITPNKKNVIPVANDYKKPNGIIGTKDGKTLYVSDRKTQKTYRYRIGFNGMLTEKQLFAEVGSDGMTLDNKGNLYVTTDAVHIFNFDGKEIADIQIPERPSNLSFGGKEGNELFITAGTGLYVLEMAVAGTFGPMRSRIDDDLRH